MKLTALRALGGQVERQRLFPTHGAPASIAAKSRESAAHVRALSTWGSNSGFQIVRGTQPDDFQGSGAEVRKLGWERHPVVNACARVVVELIQSVPLEVYRKGADGTATILPNSPALDLLRAPRVGMSGARMIGRLGMHFFLYGNAFVVIERRGRRGAPQGLRVIHPESVQYIWLREDDTVASYDWRDLQGTTHPREPVENVVHFRDLDSSDGLFGYPRLAAALLDIAADSEASQYVRQVVTNHGVPGMIVAAQAGTQRGDLDAAEQRWREKYATRGMRGMTAFVAGLESVTQIGFDLNQLEFPDLRRVTRESICAAANVDPRMISVASAANDGGLSGVQFREARHRLIQQTVYPIMRAIEDELNYWFMPEYGESLVRFSEEYIAAITEDVTATSTRVVSEVAAKIRTVEEAREAIGLDAEMDPTHTLPGGLTVEATQENAEAMSSALVLAAQTPKPAPGETPNEEKRPALSIARSFTPALVRAYTESEAEREEKRYETAALMQFGREREEWIRTITGLIAAGLLTDALIQQLSRQAITTYAENGKYARAWQDRFEELIGRTVIKGGGTTAASVGLDFSLDNPRVRGVVQRRAADLVTSVTETTRDSIRAALVTAQQQGLTVRQTAKLVEDTTFGAITKTRAQTIARTEVIGALNSGEYAAAVQSSVMRSKTWRTQGDHRVRDSHRALDGVTVDIGQAFPNGLRHPHDPLGAASEVIGCRCGLTFSDLEAGASR